MAGLGKNILRQRQHAPDMVTAGQLRHHAAKGLVHFDLAVQRVRQQHGQAGVLRPDQRHACLIAGRFNAQNERIRLHSREV